MSATAPTWGTTIEPLVDQVEAGFAGAPLHAERARESAMR
jgi:hypothetical protein